ncbi:DUF4114 domain-containing protein, partial [Leptolyngbya cf. ectocarpi LEGE 11479]
SLNGDSGLAFTVGDGTDDTSLAFSGSLADVNAALNNLTFTPNPDFDGTATVQIQTTDTPGDSDTETLSITVNNAPDVTSIALGDTSPTNATSVTFDVTFSESVTGVDVTDFALATTNTADGTIASVSGSGTSYTVIANNLTGDGSLGLNLVDNDSIVNGNSLALGGTGISGNGDGSLTGDTYTIDTTAPSAPSIPALAAISDTGSSNTDRITSSNTPTLIGTAEANSTVTVTSDVDGVIGSAIANSIGEWTIIASTLTDGSHNITAAATDSFNNVSPASGALPIIVDTAVPTVTSITPNLISIVDSNVGTGTFTLTVDFSEIMDTSIDPILSFPVEDPSNTLALNTGSWSDSDTYVATYNVADANETVSNIDVQITNAQDTAGNLQTTATQIDGFSISTISSIEFAAANFTSDESIGTSNAVTLTRTGDISTTSSVQVTITGGTAADPDYTSSSFPLTVTFAPNETTQSVAVPITDDLLSEEDETILLSLIGASNANVGSQATATLTITDNDTAGFNLSKTSAIVSEAGATDVFNITLTAAPLSDVVLTVASDNTDEAIVEPASVTLNSTNWDTGVDVAVTGVDDTAVDGDQTSTLTISVDAANSDDNFDSLSDQTLSITTTDDDIAPGLLTPFADANSLEVTSLGTDNTVRLEVEQVGVDNLSEIRIFSTDATGDSRTQIGSFSLLEGGTLPDAYGPAFTINNNAIAPGDFLQFELIDSGQTLVATPTSINDGQATLEFGEGTQLAISLFDANRTTNLLNDDASIIDLTGLAGATVNVEFSVYREAKRNNTVKFYATDSADGGIVVDPLLGTELRPGDSGYKEAALARQLEVELTGENNQVSNFAATLTGGQFLSSFLIIDSGDATAGEILFSHAGANNNNNHVQLLGDNVFGFEDIIGLGDRDFNDVVVEFAVV